jgi:hypothetical protein
MTESAKRHGNRKNMTLEGKGNAEDAIALATRAEPSRVALLE